MVILKENTNIIKEKDKAHMINEKSMHLKTSFVKENLHLIPNSFITLLWMLLGSLCTPGVRMQLQRPTPKTSGDKKTIRVLLSLYFSSYTSSVSYLYQIQPCKAIALCYINACLLIK